MKLGDVFKLSSGKSLPEKKRTPGNHNVYGGNGITVNHNDYFVEKPTIVIGRVGEYCGAVHLTTEKCWITDNALMVTEWYQEVDKQYLVYFLNAMNLHQYAKTVGQPSISQANVYGLDINLPLIEQQQEIVKILNLVSKVVIDRKEELKRLDNLIKARFVEMFGDPVTNEKNWSRLTLGDICEIGSSKRVFEKDYVSKGIPFFRTKEIVELSKGNSVSTELFITREHFAELKKSYGAPKKGDLLISAVGTIGTIWIVNGDFEFYFKDGNLIQIKASPNFNSIFMKCLLNELIANYKNEMSTGTAYSALTIVGLKNMLVYDVPLVLQEQFAEFVQQIDKSKFEVQKALDETQLLMDSLMQKYFG